MSIPDFRLISATLDDLELVMSLEQSGFAPEVQEEHAVYAKRIAHFPQGSLLAYSGETCCGCMFSEIWQQPESYDAGHFQLGHDISVSHVPHGNTLYLASMTIAPAFRGQGLGAVLLDATIRHLSSCYPALDTAVLLVNTKWQAARNIYQRNGFSDVVRLQGFFCSKDNQREDAHVMTRAILR